MELEELTEIWENIYYSIGRYKKAIDCHRIALEIAEELGDRSGIGRGHGNFIKIAYSGDFSTPPPNQSGFATPLLEHTSCESAWAQTEVHAADVPVSFTRILLVSLGVDAARGWPTETVVVGANTADPSGNACDKFDL